MSILFYNRERNGRSNAQLSKGASLESQAYRQYCRCVCLACGHSQRQPIVQS